MKFHKNRRSRNFISVRARYAPTCTYIENIIYTQKQKKKNFRKNGKLRFTTGGLLRSRMMYVVIYAHADKHCPTIIDPTTRTLTAPVVVHPN